MQSASFILLCRVTRSWRKGLAHKSELVASCTTKANYIEASSNILRKVGIGLNLGFGKELSVTV